LDTDAIRKEVSRLLSAQPFEPFQDGGVFADWVIELRETLAEVANEGRGILMGVA
jgi:hypothetical protein